jgi:hypothetical protein
MVPGVLDFQIPLGFGTTTSGSGTGSIDMDRYGGIDDMSLVTEFSPKDFSCEQSPKFLE